MQIFSCARKEAILQMDLQYLSTPNFFSQIHRVGMPFEQRTEKMLSSQLKNSAMSVNGGSNMT